MIPADSPGRSSSTNGEDHPPGYANSWLLKMSTYGIVYQRGTWGSLRMFTDCCLLSLLNLLSLLDGRVCQYLRPVATLRQVDVWISGKREDEGEPAGVITIKAAGECCMMLHWELAVSIGWYWTVLDIGIIEFETWEITTSLTVLLYRLVGGLEYFLFFHILGIIIPTDFHIVQRGRSTTNQS